MDPGVERVHLINYMNRELHYRFDRHIWPV